MRALSDVASMTGKEPIPQASGECDPSGLSPNACRFCSVKVPGYDSPHSTHKVSAIRPETSSKKTMERQGDRAGGHGWPSKPLHPATCCLGTAATGCAPRRTRRRRLLSRTWPGLQGGCIAKTLSTADLRLATPPLQKSMGDFLQARIDQGDIWEAGGRLCCRRRQGMHVSHHVVMRRVTTCALLARTRAALRSLSTKPTAAYQTTAPLSRTWPPSATASDTRRYSETSMYHVTDVPSVLSGAVTYSS